VAAKNTESAEEKIKRQQEGRLKMVMQELPELPSATLSFLASNAESELESRAGEFAESAGLLSILDIEKEIEEAEASSGKFGGLFTGLEMMDELIGGLKPSETTLIAGESNNGKSFLAAYMASQVAQQEPTLFITLEMQPATLGARIKKMLHEDEWNELQLYFQKTFRLDYRTVEPIIKNAYNNGVRAVFIDYLQYLGVGMKPDEVARISRMLSELSLTYNIPFVIVVSVRKQQGVATKDWRNLSLDDIAGTSAIAYDSDNVILVSRKNLENEYDTDGIWIKHLKSRNMPVHYGDGQYVRFGFYNNSIHDDEEFNREYEKEYLNKVEVKKLEHTPAEQAKQQQVPLDTKKLTKFEMMQLGISGEELSPDELGEIPF